MTTTVRDEFEQIKRWIRSANEYENTYGGNESMLWPLVERLIRVIETSEYQLRGAQFEQHDELGFAPGPVLCVLKDLQAALSRPGCQCGHTEDSHTALASPIGLWTCSECNCAKWIPAVV